MSTVPTVTPPAKIERLSHQDKYNPNFDVNAKYYCPADKQFLYSDSQGWHRVSLRTNKPKTDIAEYREETVKLMRD